MKLRGEKLIDYCVSLWPMEWRTVYHDTHHRIQLQRNTSNVSAKSWAFIITSDKWIDVNGVGLGRKVHDFEKKAYRWAVKHAIQVRQLELEHVYYK